MQKMVTDVADQMCWWQIVDVGDVTRHDVWKDEIRVIVKFSNGSECTLGQDYDEIRVGL